MSCQEQLIISVSFRCEIQCVVYLFINTVLSVFMCAQKEKKRYCHFLLRLSPQVSPPPHFSTAHYTGVGCMFTILYCTALLHTVLHYTLLHCTTPLYTSHPCNAISGDKCKLSCPEEVGASSTSFIGFDVECTAGEELLRLRNQTFFIQN